MLYLLTKKWTPMQDIGRSSNNANMSPSPACGKMPSPTRLACAGVRSVLRGHECGTGVGV
jgi:hypothetical protein